MYRRDKVSSSVAATITATKAAIRPIKIPERPPPPPLPSPTPGAAVTAVEVEFAGTVVAAASLVDVMEDVEVGETVVDDEEVEVEVAGAAVVVEPLAVLVVGAGAICLAIAQSWSAVRPPSWVATTVPSGSMKTSLGNPSMP